MGKKVLITGGLGFIGHHLTSSLLMHDPLIEILIVDNLSSTQIEYSWLNDRADIKLINFLDFEPQYKFDQIYHLASPVGAVGILSRNGYIAREIIALTYKVAEMAIEHYAKLVFVSSSEIYGSSGMHAEEGDKIVPSRRGTRKEYSLGKLLSEEILFNLSLEKNLNYCVARPFNVFGEYQSRELGFVIPAFFNNAIQNLPLLIFDKGSQKRSFCYVKDIVEALVLLMNSGINGETYNIGNSNNCVTILELARMIIRITDSKSVLKFVDPVKIYGRKYTEAFDKIPDITKIREKLGWYPKYDYLSSLLALKEFYKAQHR